MAGHDRPNLVHLRLLLRGAEMISIPIELAELLCEPAAHKERISIKRHEAICKLRSLLSISSSLIVDGGAFDKIDEMLSNHPIETNLAAQRLLRRKPSWEK